MKHVIISLLLIFSCFGNSALFAQADENLYRNRAVLKKYTGEQLKNMELNHPEKFKQLQYYYTKSFRVEVNGCPLCVVDFDSLVNFHLFNIADYEYMRDETYEVSVDLKYNNYTLVLTSGIDLENQLYSIKSTLQQPTVYKDLPIWNDTGNFAYDFEVYKEKLLILKKNNPDDYIQLTGANSLIKISFKEFTEMSATKRSNILSHTGGYLITD